MRWLLAISKVQTHGETGVTNSPHPLVGRPCKSFLPLLPSTDHPTSFVSPSLGHREPEPNWRTPSELGGGWRKRGEGRPGGESGGGDLCCAVILSNCCFAER